MAHYIRSRDHALVVVGVAPAMGASHAIGLAHQCEARHFSLDDVVSDSFPLRKKQAGIFVSIGGEFRTSDRIKHLKACVVTTLDPRVRRCEDQSKANTGKLLQREMRVLRRRPCVRDYLVWDEFEAAVRISSA